MHNTPSAVTARKIRPLAVVFICLLHSACDVRPMEWKEEVKLQGGDVIIVSRTARFSENWVAGGGGGSVNKGMTMRIVQPEKSENPVAWDARFVPILLDRDPDNNEWFIVATFFHCDSWYQLGRPPLPYTEYRFRDGLWIQGPLTQRWIGRAANVLPADPSDSAAIAETRPVLTLERKQAIFDASSMSPKFKRVVNKWPGANNC